MYWHTKRIIMAELIPVNILIGDRTYRIKTKPSDEEAIRRTLKTVNDKIIEFKTQFAGKDMQDYIAMVMIWYATQTSADTNPALEKEMTDALLKIEQQLDKAK
jgi:cell division protein ZapA (FtsZ GTPase activity inhibitor)